MLPRVYSAELTINRENGQMDDNTSGNGPAQSWAKAIFAITLFVEDLAVANPVSLITRRGGYVSPAARALIADLAP